MPSRSTPSRSAFVAETRVDLPVLRRGVRPVEVQVEGAIFSGSLLGKQFEPSQRRSPEEQGRLFWALGIGQWDRVRAGPFSELVGVATS